MKRKTLPREPYRGGQICGYQEEYGVVPGRTVQCGEFKALGKYFCEFHHDWVTDGGASAVRVAEGNARGLRLTSCSQSWLVRDADDELVAGSDSRETLEYMEGFTLRWEGEDGRPVDATAEEIQAWKDSGKEAEPDKSSCHHPRYCQQWDQAPTRYSEEHGTLSFSSQCAYPSTWTVTLPSDYSHNYTTRNTDTSCDVHLSQAVRRLMEGGFHALEIKPYKDEEEAP